MDGNFQQIHHLAASVENPDHLKTPSLFVKQQKVLEMELSMGLSSINAATITLNYISGANVVA
jgi:hypothetical protein